MIRIEFDDETLRRALKGAAKSEKWLNPKPLSTPGWTSQIGQDRWDGLRIEKALFEEHQAMQRLEACLFGTQLNEDIDLDEFE